MHIFWHLTLSLRWFNSRNCASQPQNSKAVTSQCSQICQSPNLSAVISETCWVFGVHTRWQVLEQQRSAPLFDLGCSSSNLDQTHPHPSLFFVREKAWSQAWTERGMAGTWKRSDPTAELERGGKGAWKSRGWLTAPKFSGYTRVPRVTCVLRFLSKAQRETISLKSKERKSNGEKSAFFFAERELPCVFLQRKFRIIKENVHSTLNESGCDAIL